MKIIPKLQYGGTTLSDNTRVVKPIFLPTRKYQLKEGETFVYDNGKPVLIKSKNEQVSQDNRTQYQKKKSQEKTTVNKKKAQDQKVQEEGKKGIIAMTKLVSPSTYVGPMFDNSNRPYFERMLGGEGTGNEVANFALDVATPMFGWLGYKYAPYLSGSYLLGNVGKKIAGNTGSRIGGAIGNAFDLGLAGTSVYSGLNKTFNSNLDPFDRAVGVGEATLGTFPLLQTGRMAFRSSFADNVVPIGYNNLKQEEYPKGKQAWNTFKDTFKKVFTLRSNEQVGYNPKWMSKVNNDEFIRLNRTLASGTENLRYRQDAINLAMKQPQYNHTYIQNPDGTYSYNVSFVRDPNYSFIYRNGKPETIWNRDLLKELKEGESISAGDNLGGNGGHVSILKENGNLYMVDKWDVQPFLDESRLPFGTTGKILHKIIPNFEIVKRSGGNPFMLKHQLRTD